MRIYISCAYSDMESRIRKFLSAGLPCGDDAGCCGMRVFTQHDIDSLAADLVTNAIPAGMEPLRPQLICAAVSLNSDVILGLLLRGIDASYQPFLPPIRLPGNDEPSWEHFPLHKACKVCKNGDIRLVELLLGAGFDVNCPAHNEDTPLHIAVRKMHYKTSEELDPLVRVLLENGADVFASNVHDDSPFMLSLRYGNLSFSNAMLHSLDFDHMAKYHLVNMEDAQCQTPMEQLLYSIGSPHTRATTHGSRPSDWDLYIDAAIALIGYMVACGACLSRADYFGDSLLHLAVSSGSPDIVKVMYNAGVPPNIRNADGRTAEDMSLCLLRGACCSACMGLGSKAVSEIHRFFLAQRVANKHDRHCY